MLCGVNSVTVSSKKWTVTDLIGVGSVLQIVHFDHRYRTFTNCKRAARTVLTGCVIQSAVLRARGAVRRPGLWPVGYDVKDIAEVAFWLHSVSLHVPIRLYSSAPRSPPWSDRRTGRWYDLYILTIALVGYSEEVIMHSENIAAYIGLDVHKKRWRLLLLHLNGLAKFVIMYD